MRQEFRSGAVTKHDLPALRASRQAGGAEHTGGAFFNSPQEEKIR